ncbi:MAG: beta-galactosidase trimerization domain-containing protein [Planctomycetota bacterium]
MRHVALFSAIALLLLLGCGTVRAQTGRGEPAPKWLEPTDEVTSFHIAWAKPDAAGPVRVLFITYQLGMREIVELCERFDIKREVFAVFSNLAQKSYFSLEDDPQAQPRQLAPFEGIDRASQEKRLREKLGGDYDCIVFGDVDWSCLPDWARKTILDKVAAGTGLVGCIGRDGETDPALEAALARTENVAPDEVVGVFPFAGLPAFRDSEDLGSFVASEFTLARAGAGRIAVLSRMDPPYRQAFTPGPIDPFPDMYWNHYDYYLALAGKAIRHAAGRRSAIRVTGPTTPATEIPREELKGVSFSVEADAPADVEIAWALRHSDRGTVVAEGKKVVSLAKGAQTIAFDVTPIPAGTYFADLWVKRGGATVDFGSQYLKVTSPSRVENVALASKKIHKDDPVRGKVAFAGAKTGQSLRISQWDIHDREVARTTIPLSEEADEMPFELSAVPALSILQRIQVSLVQGEEVLDERWAAFTYDDVYPPRDDIRCVAYHGGVPKSYLNLLLGRVYREAGIDTVQVSSVDNERLLSCAAMVMQGVRVMPYLVGRVDVDGRNWLVYATINKAEKGERGYVRVPCLTDPEYKKAQRVFYRRVADEWGWLCPPEYNLGDESCFTVREEKDLCFSDTCIADFQRFVREEYGTLDLLNEAYGSDYAGWDEVMPVSLDDARKTGNVPAWIDHRRHMNEVRASLFPIAAEELSAACPGSKIGYEGSDDPGHLPRTLALAAVDYYQLARAMTFTNPYYYPLELDAFRDFGAPGSHLGGGFFGGYSQMERGARDPLTCRWWVWNTVLRGANAVWPWAGAGVEDVGQAILAPDFSRYDFFAAAAEEIAILKSGIGKLLLAAERRNDGIAILYSPSSMLMATLTEGLPQNWDEPASMPSVFAESDFQYRLISSAQLEEGVLEEGGFRLLFLPYAQALSPREVERILAFAKSGGTVVADLRPGVCDEHGKPYGKSPLDALFGVEQDTTGPAPRRTTVSVTIPEANLKTEMPETVVDGSLKLAGGRAMGKASGAPAVVVHDHGKGKGVLLNLALSEYLVSKGDAHVRFGGDEDYADRAKHVDKARKTRALIRAAFSLGGMTPEVETTPYVPGCHTWRFASGGALFIGLLRDAPAFLPGGYNYNMWPLSDPRVPEYRAVLDSWAAERNKVTLTLPKEAHVYDIAKGEYLGRSKTISRTVTPGRVQLLAALPYRVSGIDLSVPARVAPGERVAYTAEIVRDEKSEAPVTHVLRVELVNPDGRAVAHYYENLRAPKGRGTGALNLALNEQPGVWRLVVRDIATGTVAERAFVVQESERGYDGARR